MKGKNILNALGEIDSKYIEEAIPKKSKKAISHYLWKYVAAAACLCVCAAVAGAFIINHNNIEPNNGFVSVGQSDISIDNNSIGQSDIDNSSVNEIFQLYVRVTSISNLGFTGDIVNENDIINLNSISAEKFENSFPIGTELNIAIDKEKGVVVENSDLSYEKYDCERVEDIGLQIDDIVKVTFSRYDDVLYMIYADNIKFISDDIVIDSDNISNEQKEGLQEVMVEVTQVNLISFDCIVIDSLNSSFSVGSNITSYIENDFEVTKENEYEKGTYSSKKYYNFHNTGVGLSEIVSVGDIITIDFYSYNVNIVVASHLEIGDMSGLWNVENIPVEYIQFNEPNDNLGNSFIINSYSDLENYIDTVSSNMSEISKNEFIEKFNELFNSKVLENSYIIVVGIGETSASDIYNLESISSNGEIIISKMQSDNQSDATVYGQLFIMLNEIQIMEDDIKVEIVDKELNMEDF